MSVTIDNLPEEILVKVFDHLDGKTVKKAALVCKKWNRMIGASLKIMKKFVLRVGFIEHPMNVYKFEELLNLKRNFTSASIDFRCGDKSRLMQVMERFGENFNDLSLRCSDFTAGEIARVLETTPELERLEFSLWGRELADTSVGPTVMFKKLKQLVVQGECQVLTMIKAPMLLDLSVYEYCGINSVAKAIESFLKALPKLESLQTHEVSFLEEHCAIFPFQLKKLKIFSSFDLTKNIEQFFVSQAATLETLEVNCDDLIFFELLLSKFERLKSLSVSLNPKITAKNPLFQNLKPMPFFKELRCYLSDFSAEVAMRTFLKKCPELKKLDIGCEVEYHSSITHDLNLIAENNRKLQSLAICSIESSSARFQHLQILKIYEIINGDLLLAFLYANPTIETLIVQYQDEICGNLETQMQTLCKLIEEANLKHIEIRNEESAARAANGLIKRRFGACKAIKVNFSQNSLQIDMMRENLKNYFKNIDQ